MYFLREGSEFDPQFDYTYSLLFPKLTFFLDVVMSSKGWDISITLSRVLFTVIDDIGLQNTVAAQT